MSLIIRIIKVNLRLYQLTCSPLPVAILFLLMSLLYAGTSWGQTKASNWSALAGKANAQESIRIIVQLTEDTADGSDLSSAQGWSLINAGDYDGDSNNDFLILNTTTSIVASALLQNNSVLSVVGLINLNFAPDFTLLSGKP